jgi:two-component system chemotaxis sensor kinase CheA
MTGGDAAAGDDDLLGLFAQEADGQLDRLGGGVLALERGAGGDVPGTVLEEMFRDAHTLKSSASLVELPDVRELAHGLEDVLGELRAGRRATDSALADELLRVVDGLRAAVGAGVRGPHAADAAVVETARAALERLRGEGPPGAEAQAEAGPTAFTDPMFREMFVEEVGPQLDRLVEIALDLERGGPDPELIAELFRGAHSVKGSAALVGFTDVSALAHVLEDLLGELRSGARPASPEVVDGLLGAFDAIREAVAALAAGSDPAGALARGRAALARAKPAPQELEPEPPAPAAPLLDPPPAILGAPSAAPLPAGELVPVAFDRLDRLVRLAGEAVAAELRLSHLLADARRADPDAEAAAVALRRTLRGLQQETLRTRMTSLAAIAGPLRRAARDVARAAGKEVRYALEGDVVELDRAVLDGLRDPLLHLVRNAVDHGLERPEERAAAGKPRAGTVTVRAVRRGPEVVLSVQDDGAGLDLDRLRAVAGDSALDDADAARLVFRPGLSTSANVTDVSGRGVGMDVVRAGVEALRGRVEVASVRGSGTTFTVVVPLTLAVVPCVLLAAGGERYAIPTHATVALAEDPGADGIDLEGGRAVWAGGTVVPVAALADVVGAPAPASGRGPALVLEGLGGRRHAVQVDEVLGQRDVTVKELGPVLPRSPLVSGASIEPDGSVVCVLDPVALVERAARRPAAIHEAPESAADAPAVRAPSRRPSVLVVDDVAAIRELERSLLAAGGYEVRTARDGEEALGLALARRPDLVVTDIDMPRLDGLGLCRTIRDTPALASLPVLVVTADQDEDLRRRALEAGADGYLVKGELTERRLLDAVGSLLGRRP